MERRGFLKACVAAVAAAVAGGMVALGTEPKKYDRLCRWPYKDARCAPDYPYDGHIWIRDDKRYYPRELLERHRMHL